MTYQVMFVNPDDEKSPSNPAVVHAIASFINQSVTGSADCYAEWLYGNANGWVLSVTQGEHKSVLKVGMVARGEKPEGLNSDIAQQVMSSYQYSYQELPDDFLTLEFSLQPFYPGLNYRQVLDQADQALPLEQKLHMALDAVFALRQLHAAGIAHLDFKPDNIMWDAKTAEAVLIDFDDAELMSEYAEMTLKATEQYRGTPPYIALEGWQKKQYSRKSDVYALSVMLCDNLALAPVVYHKPDEGTKGHRTAEWKMTSAVESDDPIIRESQQLLFKGLSRDPYLRPSLEQIAVTLLAIASKKLSAEAFTHFQERYKERDNYLEFMSLYRTMLAESGGKSRLHIPLDLSFKAKCEALAKHASVSKAPSLFGKSPILANRTNRALHKAGWLNGNKPGSNAPAAFKEAWDEIHSKSTGSRSRVAPGV